MIGESCYIGGKFRTASGDGIDVLNPRNEDVLATVVSATAADVAAATAAANEARKGWAEVPSTVRGDTCGRWPTSSRLIATGSRDSSSTR